MVIGPTPPGTGVIAPATALASAKATSPTMCGVAVLVDDAVDADVDHGRARLDPVRRAPSPDVPIAAISRSARAHTDGRSAVFECAMVTVAFSASSNCATGLPTMLERPITTASSPASE